MSVFCGPDVNFADCLEGVEKKTVARAGYRLSKLWVDTFGEEGEKVLQVCARLRTTVPGPVQSHEGREHNIT
eukprot:996074-Prorocentrum_minimum.AAC.1